MLNTSSDVFFCSTASVQKRSRQNSLLSKALLGSSVTPPTLNARGDLGSAVGDRLDGSQRTQSDGKFVRFTRPHTIKLLGSGRRPAFRLPRMRIFHPSAKANSLALSDFYSPPHLAPSRPQQLVQKIIRQKKISTFSRQFRNDQGDQTGNTLPVDSAAVSP